MGRWKIIDAIHRWLAKLVPSRSQRKKKEYSIQEKTDALSSHLELFCRKRKMKFRKNEHFMEWKVKPAGFLDAYSLLLEICSKGKSNDIQRSHYADYISYTANSDDDFSICLTDKPRRKDTSAVIQVLHKKQCILKIYFQCRCCIHQIQIVLYDRLVAIKVL